MVNKININKWTHKIWIVGKISLAMRRRKDQKQVKFLKSIIKEAKTIIDVGSGRNEFSRACLKVFPNSKVYAFDPNKDFYTDNLCKIYNLNFIQYSCALSDKSEIKKFNVNLGRPKQSSFLENLSNSPDAKKIKVIEVPTKRFDELDMEIKRPAILKIDTEGTELQVLKGFGEKIADFDLIQVEINFSKNFKEQSDWLNIISHLCSMGFKRFIQKNVRYGKEKLNNCDLIFTK